MKSGISSSKLDLVAQLKIGTSPLLDVAYFLVLTFGLSWLVWIPGSFLLINGSQGIGNFLLALGSFVPLAVAFYLNLFARRRTFEWGQWFKTLTLRQVLVALVLCALTLLPIMLLRVYWGTFNFGHFLSDLRDAPLLFVGLVVIAFGEEVGWRGFLLARLESFNLVVVNFIIAFAWFAWQIPVLFTLQTDAFQGDNNQFFAAYLLFSLLITPFLNRLALRSQRNVLLPTLLRAGLKTIFAIYALQGTLDLLTHPFGVGALAWLVVLNVLLFEQLWLGRIRQDSELERVMPLEPVVK